MNSKPILAPFLAHFLAPFLAPFLVAASALCLIAQSVSAATFGKFTYTDNGTSIIITDYPENATGAVVIPHTIIGKPVTSIGVQAFYYCTGLTSVSIPNSVTSIGDEAFSSCTGLTSVAIPDSVTSIGEQAFSCTGLTSVSIPKSVTSIGEQAFEYCTGLTSVSIPNSVIYIEGRTFYYCTGLTSVSIPNSVTTISDHAFESCTGLTSISIPNSVTSIGYCAFSACTGLTSVSIPNSVIYIREWAFRGCFGLTSVSISNSVTSIGEQAFGFCIGLTSVSIPQSVTSIGDKAFYYCTGLTRTDFIGNAPTMGYSVFDNTASGFTVYYIKEKIGFTTPTWLGYPCVGMDPDPEIAVQQPAGTNIADGDSKTFPTTTVGTSRSLVFTIKNSGSGNLTGLNITKDDANTADFTITTNPVAPVAPGGSTTFTVRFSPTTKGSKTAAIHIASNDADENPYDITLTGWGIAATPEIAVEQPVGSNLVDGTAKKSFGTVIVGRTSTAKTFTIKNVGTATLSRLAITKNGTHAANFMVSTLSNTSLAPGSSTSFKVKFKPTKAGARKATIHIKSNDSNENPFDINLTGQGASP